MEFALGQNVWVMESWDPTVNWVEGVIIRIVPGFSRPTTYCIAIWNGDDKEPLVLYDIPVYDKNYGGQFLRIKPYFLNLNRMGVGRNA